MPKYLVQVSFTVEGTKGLVKEGGTKRREAVEQFIRSAGGKLEALYFALGETDAFAIMDLPDNVSMAAASLAANAAGLVQVKTTVLLTPEEMDQAAKKSANYRPPGT
ncbi:MAG: GYD domain-containing protein [Candidatus Binatia bacterium]